MDELFWQVDFKTNQQYLAPALPRLLGDDTNG